MASRRGLIGGGGGNLPDLTDNAGVSITSGVPILLPDGTAANPSLAFTNNTNYGLFRDASGVELSFAGTNFWRWDSAGQFHIGGSLGAATAGIYIDSTLGTSIGQITRASGGGLNIQGNSAAPMLISVGSSGTGINISYGAGASTVTIGGINGATPAARALTVGESSRGGTDSNTTGATGTVRSGIGTGNGNNVGSKFAIQRNLMGATGTTAQSTIDAFTVGGSKTLSNTSATAQTLATITLGSNAAGGCWVSITVTATDGTNFDSETQSANISFVNKAGAITVGGPVITATSAANNSGSATIGMTAVANGNNIDIKVTPVFTTIVPTTVTSFITVINNGVGNVAIA